METPTPLLETLERMTRLQLPNLFRLYLNPFVAQTCLCLERYVQTRWSLNEPFQSFLANSFDEALSGAIKLARYHASVTERPTNGLVIDASDRLGPFAAATSNGQRVEFIPGLTVVRNDSTIEPAAKFGFVVIVSGELSPTSRAIIQEASAMVIVCVDRSKLRQQTGGIPPDIVVFDESFVDHEVPFGAFTARQSLYDHWNGGGKSTFHSTTFQPNTVSTLHFMRCLAKADPEFLATLAPELGRLETDIAFRRTLFKRLYSPSLASAIAMTGCDTTNVTAVGHYVHVGERKILDTVGGVACSVRGHNPPTYVAEMNGLANTDCENELADRLRRLTGLAEVLPAVSGASAVENALRLALVAQFPRRHVLALKAGFGGKTLLALTGTWSSSYKQHIDPLYGEVSYIDPFAVDALAQIDAVLAQHEVAVVQMELIQGVGGVRRVPEEVVRHLERCRAKHGYLLLVDEVQTGIHRTGPFTLSSAMNLMPDLLVVGKAISNMMFPFALTLFSAQVRDRLREVAPELPAAIGRRYRYPFGFRTALNVLQYAERAQLSQRVTASGEMFARLLRQELSTCKTVREVRVFGLLIGIELDDARWPQCWFRKRLFWFYVAALLRHPRFPVLVGFCQGEPNVLKITPPLTIEPAEIQEMCAVIGEVLRRPFYRLLGSALGGFLRSFGLRRVTRERTVIPADAAVAR